VLPFIDLFGGIRHIEPCECFLQSTASYPRSSLFETEKAAKLRSEIAPCRE
jgi:hypothetical protein